MDYTPEPIDTSNVKLPKQLDELLEILAQNTHEHWAQQRLQEGWSPGDDRNDAKKTHPGLVPYDKLPEEEKNYDRLTVMEALKTIVALGYQITPPSQTNRDATRFKATIEQITKRLENPKPIKLTTLMSFHQTLSALPQLVGAKVYRLLGKRILAIGEPLLAYDVINQGLTDKSDDVRLLQLKGLALARNGAALAANHVMAELYDSGHRDGDTLGILARTYKDLWEQANDPAVKEQHLQQSHRVYQEAYAEAVRKQQTDDIIYTGINAATTGLLLGQERRAKSIAKVVQSACLRKRGYENDYWTMATIGEAAVILKDFEIAELHYQRAAALGKGDYANLAATRRNLRLLRDLRDTAQLERTFPVPSVIVFAGHMIDAPRRAEPRFPPSLAAAIQRQIADYVDKAGESIGYSSAACGSDILFVEEMLKRKREVHLVLPLPPDEFARVSVAVRGGNWLSRFDKLLKQVARVLITNDRRHSGAAVAYDYAEQVLCGTARGRARSLAAHLRPLVVWDGNKDPESGRTAAFVSFLRSQDIAPDVIDIGQVRSTAKPAAKSTQPAPAAHRYAEFGAKELFPQEIHAMLFADVVHYSRLTDEQTPLFVQYFLGAAAELLAASPHAPIAANTWGDAFYFVFRTVSQAGAFALDLRDKLCDTTWPDHGLPAGLSLRIALHAGPVYKVQDPIIRRNNYTGSHVSRAARIEPITPHGEVYASEPFAALAEMEAGVNFVCEYVGQISLPKAYGTFPTFHLRRKSS